MKEQQQKYSKSNYNKKNNHQEQKSKNSNSKNYENKNTEKNSSYGKKFDKASKYSDIPEYVKKQKSDKKNFENNKVRKNKIKSYNSDIELTTIDIKKPLKKKTSILPIKKVDKKQTDGIRLNKYIANSGICSRREADTLISTGAVTINGKIESTLGTKVMPGDIVKVGEEKINPERKIYLLLNKPKDYITTLDDEKDRKTVMDLVENACSERIYPVGRLDRNTTGLLLFTNDGEMTTKLTHPSYNKRKIYHVFLENPITSEHLLQIKEGINLEDGPIAADQIDFVNGSRYEVGIELHSGRNRIVRRIFEHFGYSIKKLDRVYYAGLTKKDLPRGKWRFLTDAEIAKLHSGMYK